PPARVHTQLYPPSLHDALPIFATSPDPPTLPSASASPLAPPRTWTPPRRHWSACLAEKRAAPIVRTGEIRRTTKETDLHVRIDLDRKSTRLNSSHQIISYAVFC